MGGYTKHCDGCPYKDGNHLEKKFKNIRRGLSPTDYEINSSDVLIVLQSPGTVEWEKGKPLQNSFSEESACIRLKESWERVGVKREDFDIANVVLCYQGKCGMRDCILDELAVNHCSERLKDLIITNKYKKIIVFGSPAKKEVQKIYVKLGFYMEIVYNYHPCAPQPYKPLDEDLDSLW